MVEEGLQASSSSASHAAWPSALKAILHTIAMDRNTREWKRHGLVYDTPMGRAGRGPEIGALESNDSGIKMMRQSVGGSGAAQDEVSESR